MIRNEIVQTTRIYHTNKYFLWHFSMYLPITSYFFRLKQVFAEAQRNDNRKTQARLAFVLRQFIKATRHSNMPRKVKNNRLEEKDGTGILNKPPKAVKASCSRENQASPKVLCCPMLCLCQDFPN